MSKSANSPTARLLRSSRLFSLPRPLPQQQYDARTAGVNVRTSDTATLPHPSYQAITTPSSSLHRGDWGLKRPLPAKTTRRTSTPHIVVRAQDNTQHITDFKSAADHTLTEAKWQELAIPIVQRQRGLGLVRDREAAPSVYESSFDNTFLGGPGVSKTRGDRGRAEEAQTFKKWKQDSPWLKGMSQGEFDTYVSQTIVKRKTEWRKFLADHITERKVREARDLARTQGNAWDEQTLASMRAELRANEAEVFQEERELRDGYQTLGLFSELTRKLSEFLDMPGMHIEEESPALNMLSTFGVDTNPSANQPFSTHPAAGLSHLRTNAIMENHPVHGPQMHRAPFSARVLIPKRIGGRDTNAQLPTVGLAGFAASHPSSRTNSNDTEDTKSMLSQHEPDVYGGNKVWVHPVHATVDEMGHVQLSVTPDDDQAVAVRTNNVERLHQMKESSKLGIPTRSVQLESSSTIREPQPRRGTRENANYGGALPRPASMSNRFRAVDQGNDRSARQPHARDAFDGYAAPDPPSSRVPPGKRSGLSDIQNLLGSQPKGRR